MLWELPIRKSSLLNIKALEYIADSLIRMELYIQISEFHGDMHGKTNHAKLLNSLTFFQVKNDKSQKNLNSRKYL